MLTASRNHLAVTHLLSGEKPEHWRHQMLMKTWTSELSSLPEEMQKFTVKTALYKTTYFNIRYNSHALWYLFKLVTKHIYKTALNMDIYRSFIHNCQKFGSKPRLLSVGERINKMWYVQTMEYYSALRRNELWIHKSTWRTVKCLLPNGGSQSKKAVYYMIPNYMTSWEI